MLSAGILSALEIIHAGLTTTILTANLTAEHALQRRQQRLLAAEAEEEEQGLQYA